MALSKGLGIQVGLALALMLSSGVVTAKDKAEKKDKDSMKLGYYDMQKAIQETSTGRKAKKDLEQDFKKRQKQITQKEKDLKTMQEDLQKKSAALSAEALARKQQEFQKEVMEYQKMVQESQLEMQKKQNELTGPIVKKIRGIVADLAKEGKYAAVFERNEQSILWVDPEIDLTSAIVKKFEKEKK